MIPGQGPVQSHMRKELVPQPEQTQATAIAASKPPSRPAPRVVPKDGEVAGSGASDAALPFGGGFPSV